MNEHGLGCLRAPDARDHHFPLRSLLAVRVHRKNTFWPMFNLPLNQRATGTCVEHGWKHWGMAAPIVSTRKLAKIPQYDLYREMIGIDEWTDNDNDTDLQMGTSVRAGAKVFQQHGFLTSYGWAFDADTAIDWLVTQGPLVIGINWYNGMDTPSAEGFIHPSGGIAGGHCMCLLGWSEKRGAVYGTNSWGPGWGALKGRFWMTGEDFERLLSEDGECCSAMEIRSV